MRLFTTAREFFFNLLFRSINIATNLVIGFQIEGER